MRIAVISDTHLTSVDPRSLSLFPRHLNRLGYEGDELYELLRQQIEIAYRVVITYLKESGPWDMLVHLGDATGGYAERGASHYTILPLLDKLHDTLYGVTKEVRLIPENHDLGWKGTGTRSGGLTPESMRLYEKRFGSPFWAMEAEGIVLIGVCSSLLKYGGSDEGILRLKSKQAKLIRAVEGLPIVLFIHNPFAVRQMDRLRRRLKRVIYGDLHHPSTEPWVNFLAGLRRGTLCPSTAPLWWRGYGLLELNLLGGRLEVKRICLPRPESGTRIPTASPLRCLYWMAKPKAR